MSFNIFLILKIKQMITEENISIYFSNEVVSTRKNYNSFYEFDHTTVLIGKYTTVILNLGYPSIVLRNLFLKGQYFRLKRIFVLLTESVV